MVKNRATPGTQAVGLSRNGLQTTLKTQSWAPIPTQRDPGEARRVKVEALVTGLAGVAHDLDARSEP
jgi:hypothetical protein